jgi:hypothetical protein
MPEGRWLLVGGAVLFVASTALVLAALGGGPPGLFTTGLLGLFGAALCLAIGAWRLRTRPDWRRVDAEQRLWAGPLGRAWLRIRQALLRL